MAYSCKSGVCAGTDADTTQQIKLLQREINRYATDPDIGFSPLAIDGLIGSNTTTAALYALTSVSLADPNVVGVGLPGTASNLIDMINAPSDLVQVMTDTASILDTGATLLNRPQLDVTPAPATGKTGGVAKSTNAGRAAQVLASKPGLATSALLGFPVPNWAVYGGVAAIVGLLGYSYAKKHGYVKK